MPGPEARMPKERRIRIARAQPTERERRCLITGESDDAAALIRFAIAPDGRVVPDIAARLPGRGYWVRADRAVVDEAVRREVFAKASARATTSRSAKYDSGQPTPRSEERRGGVAG